MHVEIDGLRAEREGGFVLDIPALALRSGRTTAILGPNGSGKTTLLRSIAGLERPRAGIIRAGGRPVQPGRDVAYVFQEDVFLRRSVRENLELGLRLRGVEAPLRGQRIAEAAELLGITPLLDRRADHLSGGEGRRVSLARALCLRAPLVLLDEPLAGLDERTYSRLMDELPQLLSAFEATTLVVTHNRHEAFRLAEDLVVLAGGRVHAAGPKHDVALNPRVREVADVLGYVVVPANGRLVAIAPQALRPGPGRLELSMTVEHVVDLVGGREAVGRIGETRVRVALPESDEAPAAGERLLLHTEQWCELA